MPDFEDSNAPIPLSLQAMATRPKPYLDGLNPAQRTAVETINGPVLMLAGAGTGKTRALTARIAHILATATARSNEVLAVTFTNKAAREMKTRVEQFLGGAGQGLPWMGTFHSICVKLLRRHAELVDLKTNFTILDTDDQLRLLKQIIQATDIDEKRWPARVLLGVIEDWKNRALTPAKIPAADAGAFDHRGVDLYAAYQARLKTLNAVDFGDLLLHVIRIFQENPNVLEKYRNWFRYILVDEYQDTNIAQYLWLRLLADGHRNICVVGDDDQSIYGWRGAEVGNILRFEKDFPGAHVVRLEQNYRSTGHILAAASKVIAGNHERLGKTLWTDAGDGEKIRLIGHWDGEEEARWIGEEIEAMHHGTRGQTPASPDDIAILVRASHQMRAFEDRFLTIGLPYRVIGGPRFYERMEIRDAMAYFRVVVSPDDGLAFERILNTPKRGLGDKALASIRNVARDHGIALIQAAQYCCDHGVIKGRGGKSLRLLLDDLARWHALARGAMGAGDFADDLLIEPDPADPVSHMQLAEMILDESGYTNMWQTTKTPEAPGRLENLKELIKALEAFENLQGFLEHVALIMDNEQDDNAPKVTLMTLHAAKGLEYPVVFLPGWEDGLFPNQRAMDESGQKGLEEERRLAYVGITRAEKVCIISFAGNRRVYGQWQNQMPSRFVDELSPENVEILTPPGLYGHQGGGDMVASANKAQGSDLHDQAARADVYNSPGWRRLQANQRQYATRRAPSDARNIIIDGDTAPRFGQGDRVFHQKFGYGQVMSVEGDKYGVAFDKAGTKQVVGRFLSAA